MAVQLFHIIGGVLCNLFTMVYKKIMIEVSVVL